VVTAVRLLMGAIYFLNGLNWWFKIITPYPSMSDFVHMQPPPDVVGAMIQNGVLFHIVKATELLTGLALLTNRFVPLMLVAALPVTLPICVVDVFFVHSLRGLVMGGGSLLLNLSLLLAYLNHYRPMLEAKGVPALDAPPMATRDGGVLGRSAAAIGARILPALGFVDCAVGLLMLGWLIVMIVQYVLHPLPLGAIHPLRPR
jgi:hypothetical protein